MIDPTFAAHRTRLAPAVDHWRRQHDVYRKSRRETLINYVGTTEFAKALGVAGNETPKQMLGNLIQLAGIAHSTTLAYNVPRYLLVANRPAADNIVMRGKEFLNQYPSMIGLGAVARSIALDSFMGYGIIRVDQGLLPPGIRHLTGQQVGPMCRRISQDNLIFDGDATDWPDVAWISDLVLVPLEAAKQYPPFLAYNPEGAANLSEFTRDSQGGNTDSRIHNGEGTGKRAVAMTQLITMFFPHSNAVAVWPANDMTFKGIAEKPLLVTEWTGHHTGPYAVLSHLDVPDNLIPVPQVESVKGLHFLFNELADITSHQATQAKTNPAYEMGAQRDIETWQNAPDRQPVPVGNLQKLGTLVIPGPDQSQTSYMNAVFQMFNEFSGNPRDTLGLGATAPTARQSELIRASTTVRGGEARRRMNEVMELVGRKLLHLALNDQTLRFPMRTKLPHTNLSMDVSWLPPSELPRTPTADDFGITVVAESMEFRSPQQRLAQLNEATGQILQLAMAASQGAPIDMEKVVETQAEYRDLPELREWWSGILPEFQQAKASGGGMSMGGDKPNGNYTRTNVSERTGAGAMTEALTQFSSPPAEAA